MGTDRGLVRRVFFTNRAYPVKQVIFSAASAAPDSGRYLNQDNRLLPETGGSCACHGPLRRRNPLRHRHMISAVSSAEARPADSDSAHYRVRLAALNITCFTG